MLARRYPLWILLAAGVLVPRAYLIFRFRSALIESDEAVMGLIARHMIQGQFPIFFYGQHYMGTLEGLLLVPFFVLFGATPFILKLVPLFLFLGFLVAHYRLAMEVVSREKAILATFLVGISSNFLVIWSMKCRGSMVLLLLGTVALLMTARMLRNGYSWSGFGWLGVVLGLAWWSHFLAAVYILPIGILLLLRDESRCLRLAPLAVVGFLIGSLPFWIYNLTHHGASLFIGGREQTNLVTDAWNIFGVGFPVILGARPNWGEVSYFPGAALIVVGIFLFTLVRLSARWFGSKGPREWAPGHLLLIFALCDPVITAASGFAWFMSEPRYLIAVYSVVFILIVAAIDSKRILIAVFSFFLALNLWGSLTTTHPEFTAYTNTESLGPLIQYLDQHGLHAVYAPYWLAYRLDFESHETIIATPLEDDTMRYPPYLETVRKSPNPAYIQLRGARYGHLNHRIEPPAGFASERVGQFEVFFKPRP